MNKTFAAMAIISMVATICGGPVATSASAAPDSALSGATSHPTDSVASASSWSGEIDNYASDQNGNVQCLADFNGEILTDYCGDVDAYWHVRASVVLSTGTYYQYQNNYTGECLGVHAASSTSTYLAAGGCDGTSDHSQFWQNEYYTSTYYQFLNGHSGLCMGTQGYNTGEQTTVVQGACSASPFSTTQIWHSIG